MSVLVTNIIQITQFNDLRAENVLYSLTKWFIWLLWNIYSD